MTEMRAGINVADIAGERLAITLLGLGEFAFLEIDIAELEVVVGVVDVVNFRLEFLDAGAALGAG